MRRHISESKLHQVDQGLSWSLRVRCVSSAQALRPAQDRPRRRMLLLNNDVLVGSGWLEDMVAALEQDAQIGMVGPVTNHISGRQRIADIPCDDTPGFHKFAGRVREAHRGKLTPRRRIAGFAILMRKVLYDELGDLDEMYGSGNYEDDDLCLRVRARGYAVMVNGRAFARGGRGAGLTGEP